VYPALKMELLTIKKSIYQENISLTTFKNKIKSGFPIPFNQGSLITPLGLSPKSANTCLTSYSHSKLPQCNFLLQLSLVILSVGEDQEQKTASDTVAA